MHFHRAYSRPCFPGICIVSGPTDLLAWDVLGDSCCAAQRVTALPDAATYRTAVDATVAAGKYAAAAALCGDAHDTGTFCHYTLPPPSGAIGGIH